MSSIRSRLLLANGLVLALFVVATALALSWSVQRQAESALRHRLEGMVYGLLGATEVDASKGLRVFEGALPDRALLQASSDLQASVWSASERLWQSPSSVREATAVAPLPVGDWRFDSLLEEPGSYRLVFSTAWVFDSGKEFPFQVQVVDGTGTLARDLARFDRSLWWLLSGVALLLLLVQWGVMHRALLPLRRTRQEVSEVERGERERISDDVARELQPLTRGLNALLDSERERQQRHRHLVDDLAHTLKTPLSVIRHAAEEGDTDRALLRSQAEQMQASIERTVARARRQQSRYLGSSVRLRPIVERIAASLAKLYRDPAVSIDIRLAEALMVRMDSADLHEVFGNLLDNACRYGASRVVVEQEAAADGFLVVLISDDGPGFQVEDPEVMLERGVRADLATAGSGSGLDASRQLLRTQRGELSLENGGELGGGVLRLTIPC